MIGQTIQSTTRFPLGTGLFFALGSFLVIVGVAQSNLHWIIASVLPLSISVFLWLSRPRPFVAHFTEDTLEVMEPLLSILYEKMDGLKAKGRSSDLAKKGPRSYPIQVHHDEGVLDVPARLNVPSDDVYRFLMAQFSPGGSRAVNPLLESYVTMHEATFGKDHLWTYSARKHLGTGFKKASGRAVSLAVVLVGIIWAMIGFLNKDYEPWGWMGFTVALFGSLFFFLFWLGTNQAPPRLRNWRDAGLVISPVGLAVIQGDLKGEMRWDELTNVHLKPRGSHLQHQSRLESGPGIRLVVEGATIVLADIYDRPLRIIYERILAYWKRER
jgi:hypothetical protein